MVGRQADRRRATGLLSRGALMHGTALLAISLSSAEWVRGGEGGEGNAGVG